MFYDFQHIEPDEYTIDRMMDAVEIYAHEVGE